MENDSAQKIADEIARQTRLQGKQILEVGCGDGRISSLLVDQVGSLTAIDPDPDGIKRAQENISRGVFCVGSGENIEYPNNHFDLAVFTLSLHHQESARALREAARVVTAGGEIIVVEPVVGGELGTIYAVVHDEDQAKRAAREALAGCGLRIEGERTFSTAWRFRDENDLYQTVFEYYAVPFDRKKAEQIDTLIGAKCRDRPIVLQDPLVILTLAVD